MSELLPELTLKTRKTRLVLAAFLSWEAYWIFRALKWEGSGYESPCSPTFDAVARAVFCQPGWTHSDWSFYLLMTFGVPIGGILLAKLYKWILAGGQ